jgi:hypothetical protein
MPLKLLEPAWSQFGFRTTFPQGLPQGEQCAFCSAPELLRVGTTPTPATDVFTLGLLFYEAVFGVHALQTRGAAPDEASYREALKSFNIRELVPPDAMPFAPLLRSALDEQPAKRCSASQFGEHLRAIVAEGSLHYSPD